MTTGLVELSAVRLRELLQHGEVSAEEVCRAFLDRAERLESRLHAFHRLTPELALRRARTLDRNRPDGVLPPLWGIPLGDKDLFDRAGVRSTSGSRAYAHRVATDDSPLVTTLDRAGAVSLGKTATPEFGMNGYTENLVFPPPRNPWAPDCGPGGSSGGAAVAVAARMLPLAPGNDGGGSIRIPAAACGLVGLKPGRGVVPDQSGVGTVGGLATAGPIARSAADAALLFDAMTPRNEHGRIPQPTATAGTGTDTASAGPSRPGLWVLPELRRQVEADPGKGLRIGIATATPWDETYTVRLAPEGAEALNWAARALSGLGGEVDEIQLPATPGYASAFRTVWHAGMAAFASRLPDHDVQQFEPMTRWAIERGRSYSAVDLCRALALFDRLERDAAALFTRVDVLLTPVLAQTPRPIGWFHDDDPEVDFARQCAYEPYTSWVNVAGLPAVTVPAVQVSGIPMGVQLVGGSGSEIQLLALAAALQGLNGSDAWTPPLTAAV
ncbi:MAG: amidase, partial [Microbacteriaceae bacterium]|nr:amidase [Microbacteriaceae bacterium]